MVKIRQLRWLEVEIEDDEVERDVKVRICWELERLNAVREEGRRW